MPSVTGRYCSVDESEDFTVFMLTLLAALTSVAGTPAPNPAGVPYPGVAQADACSLLTEDQVSAAIEAKTQPGKHATASSTRGCLWSDDTEHAVDHRRVTLTYSALAGFDVGKKVSRPAAEPVSGVGDEAYYEFFGADSPALVVKKGATVFTVRILNGLKAKALDKGVLKTRELELAKAAAAKV